jgi:hypothetical protein
MHQVMANSHDLMPWYTGEKRPSGARNAACGLAYDLNDVRKREERPRVSNDGRGISLAKQINCPFTVYDHLIQGVTVPLIHQI